MKATVEFLFKDLRTQAKFEAPCRYAEEIGVLCGGTRGRVSLSSRGTSRWRLIWREDRASGDEGKRSDLNGKPAERLADPNCATSVSGK